MSIRLYIGNLPKEVMERQELQEVFKEEGDSVTTKLITDRKTGKCRGFGFVTVKNDEQADQIIEKYNGYQFKETPLKIEKALPRTKIRVSRKILKLILNQLIKTTLAKVKSLVVIIRIKEDYLKLLAVLVLVVMKQFNLILVGLML